MPREVYLRAAFVINPEEELPHPNRRSPIEKALVMRNIWLQTNALRVILCGLARRAERK
jgi:hypothetical protein